MHLFATHLCSVVLLMAWPHDSYVSMSEGPASEVWGWCFPNHDRAGPPSPGAVARVLTLLCDSLCLHSCFFQIQEEEEEGNC